MTPQERHAALTKMENRVRNFTISQTGTPYVEGGFGELPHSTDTSERIANLHRAIDGFRLVGNGVEVAGSYDTGYIIG